MVDIPNLSYAFMDGVSVDTRWGEHTLSIFSPGTIAVTSGKIIACDPFIWNKHVRFERSIPLGTYPILLSILRRKEGGGGIVAFARIQVQQDVLPERWEVATMPEEETKAIFLRKNYGYPVDFGTGCFMDADGLRHWEKILEKFYDRSGEDLINPVLDKSDTPWKWGIFVLNEESGLNVVAFSSGDGDGYFNSYWGLDAGGKVVCLVTDFKMFRNVSDSDDA